MAAIRNVSVIPARPIQELKGLEPTAKKRVCAYCRVSTDSEEQQTSYEAQVSYYTEYIRSKPEWEFINVYADEGISGTNTKKRVQFKRMIDDCLSGKIDMVITKSISRFARNTVDCVQYIRQLKEKNIAVFFEKENINTLDAKGELLISLLGSLAQEESRNLSTNVRWGIVHQFQQGKVRVNHNKFLGYTKDENGELIIVPEQAEVVRRIYREFLDGKSAYKIAAILESEGILTGAGRAKWRDSTVIKILKNEKYQGDALLQKTYTVDFLTKKRVVNKGIVPQYYVENSHPAIVSKEEFAAVQAEFERRSNMRGYSKTGRSAFTSEYPFSGMLFCQECGSKFRRQIWGKGKYKKYVWRCINRELNGVDGCSTKPVKEKDLEKAFVRAINKVIGGKETFLKTLLQNISKGIESVEPEFTREQVNAQLEKLQHRMMTLVKSNVRNSLDALGYDKEYATLAGEIELLHERMRELNNAEIGFGLCVKRKKEIQEYLSGQETALNKFDGDLFRRLVEKIKVKSMLEVMFVFRIGIEVEEML